MTKSSIADLGLRIADCIGRAAKSVTRYSALRLPVSALLFSLLPLSAHAQNIAVTTRHAPNLNGQAVVHGSVQMLLGEGTNMNGGATLDEDLLVPGTPNINVNGNVTWQGTQPGTGSTSPSGYTIHLNGGASLRYVRTRTNAVALPTVSAPPNPTGTQNININSQSQTVSNWAVVRDLTLNGNAGSRTVPPGTYGTFTANGQTTLVLGIVGGTTPAVYNLQNLNLNGQSNLSIVGPVQLTVKNGFNINGQAGAGAHPEWLEMRVSNGGVNLNGGAQVYGSLVAPSGTVHINGGADLYGTIACDRFTLNGGGEVHWRNTTGGANNPPVANAQSVSTPEDTAKAITLAGSDPDGNAITYSIITQPAHGTLSGSAPNLIYTPLENYFGPDSFTFTVSDGTATSAPATVSITVTPVNDAPVAQNLSLSTSEDGAANLTLMGSDADGDVITHAVVTQSAHGSVSISGYVATYTPAANYHGPDSFTYTATDSNGAVSNIATVSVTVNPIQDTPVANPIAVTIDEDQWTVITLTGSDEDNDPLTFAVATQPQHGVLTGTALNLVYTPNANHHGTDSFTFTASDASDTSSPATVTITINPVNDAPVSASATFHLNEDGSLSFTVTGTDVDDTSLSFEIVSDVSNGALTGVGPGYVYTPDGNFFGTDTFTYLVRDPQGGVSALATITLEVASVNDVPVANAQSVLVAEDGSVTFGLLATDVDGDPLTYTIITQPTNGTAVISRSDVTYSPAANYTGTDSLVFEVSDANGGVSQATVSITVTPVNDVPVVAAIAITTNEDQSVAITLTGLDTEGDPLTYTIATQPQHGTLVQDGASVTYTPNANYYGTDTFTYTATDGTDTSAPATVTITINPVNDAPVADAKSETLAEDGNITVTLTGIDIENDTLTFSIVSQPGHGTAVLTGASVLYTPSANFNGTDAIVIIANDGNADSGPATIAFTVTPVNDAPTANVATLALNEDTSAVVTLTGSDIDGDTLTYAVATQPTHGTVVLNGANTTYTPAANYHGSDSFTFLVNDGTVDSAPATVSITITPINDAPTANVGTLGVNEDTAGIATLSGTDPDGDTLTYSISSQPAHGSVILNGNQATYTPATNYHGADSFTFTVNDGRVDSAPATVSITVAPINDTPSANVGTLTLNEDTSAVVTLTGSDIDGDPLTYAVATQPAHGTVVLNGADATYTPAANYYGSDSFTFTVNDGTVNSTPALVSITVQPVNDAPVVNAGGDLSVMKDTALPLNATITDDAYPGSVLTSTWSQVSGSGTAVFANAASAITTVTFDTPGSYVLRLTANDGELSGVDEVTVVVEGPSNGAVQVNAGPDQLLALPATAQMESSVQINGAPAESGLQYAWSVVNGGTGVTFSNAASATPIVSFASAGHYNLRLTVTAPEGTNSDIVGVTVDASLVAGPEPSVNSTGREFWMTFLNTKSSFSESPYSGADLVISSETAASGKVEIFFSYLNGDEIMSYRQEVPFTVSAGGRTTVPYSEFGAPQFEGQEDRIAQSAVHITSNAPVSIHALSYREYTTDGALILPNSMLGREYLVMSYRNSPPMLEGEDYVIGGTQFAVVATQENTQVTIKPTAASSTNPALYPAGQPFTVTLNRGDVYRMTNDSDPAGDFTGTSIVSSKPVAVFGGHALTTVPISTSAADHLYEQIPPVEHWGRHFVTLPLKGRVGDRFRVLASQDSTFVSINSKIVANLSKGGFHEFVLTQPAVIMADKPVLLAQFAHSTEYDQRTGDPLMMLIPPYQQFGRNYVLSTPEVFDYWAYQYTDIYDSYLSVVVQAAHSGEVRINGQPIPPAEFVSIGQSGFVGASISVPKRSILKITSPVPVGTWLYGWAPYESYGFTGGMYAQQNGSARIELTQASDTAPTGGTHRVRATVIGASGLPTPDATVQFSVTGANPASGSSLTEVDGSVEFTWTGSQAGNDLITVTSGALESTLNVTWVSDPNQPPVVNAGQDLSVYVGAPLALTGSVTDDGLPANGTLSFQWQVASGLGGVAFSAPDSLQTTATFALPGQYRLRLVANDGMFASEDELVVTVNAPPVFRGFSAPSVATTAYPWDWQLSAEDTDGTITRIELFIDGQSAMVEELNEVFPNRYYSHWFNTDGLHQITVRITDNQGAVTERSMQVDVLTPVNVVITSPANNAQVNVGQPLQVTATVSSIYGAITEVVYYSDNGTFLGSGAGANYAITINPQTVGEMSIMAYAYDETEAYGISRWVRLNVVSAYPPTITLTSPAPNTEVYLGENTTVTANVVPTYPATIDRVEFYHNEEFIGSDSEGPYEVEWEAVTAGQHTLSATVYDSYGASATSSVSINASNGLQVQLGEPLQNAYLDIDVPTSLMANIEDPVGTLIDVEFRVNGVRLNPASSLSLVFDWTPQVVGIFQVQVAATDRFGNTTQSSPVTVQVADLHAPRVQFMNPQDGASFLPLTPVAMSVIASDIDGTVQTLELAIDGEVVSNVQQTFINYVWQIPTPGWHTLSATATDNTDQTGNSESLQIFIQRPVAPEMPAPLSLAADPLTPKEVQLSWAAPATPVYGFVVERAFGTEGTWEEIGTATGEETEYFDGEVDYETYYRYRIAALNEAGGRSIYSNEVNATTYTYVPQYAVIDITESLRTAGIAALISDPRMMLAQNGGGYGGDPVDLGDVEVLGISDENEVLLEIAEGRYVVWRLGAEPVVINSVDAARKFSAYRITKGGTVTGGVKDPYPLGGGADLDMVKATILTREGEWSEFKHLTPDVRNYTYPRGQGPVDIEELIEESEEDPDENIWHRENVHWRNAVMDQNAAGKMVGRASVIYTKVPLEINGVFPPLDPPRLSIGDAALWNGVPASASSQPDWLNLGSLGIADYVQVTNTTYEAMATAINSEGLVVGLSANRKDVNGEEIDTTHAFRSNGKDFDSDGEMVDLGALESGRASAAWDINDNGLIIGTSTLHEEASSGQVNACIWDGSTVPFKLPNFGATTTTYPDGFSFALDVNDRDRIVGNALKQETDGNGQPLLLTPAVIWQRNKQIGTLFGTPSNYWELVDINDQINENEVVTTHGNETRNLKFKEWFLAKGIGINNSGLIVGIGTRFSLTDPTDAHSLLIGQRRSFLLHPVLIDIRQPENPAPILLASLGAAPVGLTAGSGTGTVNAPSQEDDFVVVSNGTDYDLASELVINVPINASSGTITANIKMSGNDGDLIFEKTTVLITPGTPSIIKIWGKTTSAGANTSKVEFEFVMPNGAKSVVNEDLTIIDGVEIEFEGNYYINVDTREFSRRPWDGRVDTKPNTKGSLTGRTDFMNFYFSAIYPGRAPTQAEKDAFKKAVDQSDKFGYASAVSFKAGDNSSIPIYMPWADTLKVVVTKVTAQNPRVVLKNDKILGAAVALKSGRLDGTLDGSEKLLNPKLELGDFVLLEKTTSSTPIARQTPKALSVTSSDITNGITTARGKGYDELLDFYTNKTNDLFTLSGERYKWENDTFDVTRKAKFTDSIAAKALAAKRQTSGKVGTSWIFQDWNEFKFQGKLSEAKVSTK